MTYARLSILWLVAATLVGCTPDPSGPSTDTESHWLVSCASNDACPEGSECLCGVCSAQCMGEGSCKGVPDETSCVSGSNVPSTCPKLQGSGACLQGCDDDAECRERDSELECVEGSCTRTPYDPLSCPSDPPGSEQIDLGAEGLSDGDRIDPYLEEHLADDRELHVPAGTYDWNGGGFDEPLQYASVVADGEVTLRMPQDYEFRVEIVTDTRFELRGLTLRGRAGAEGGLAAFATSPDGEVTLRDITLPDGSVSAQRSGVYVDPSHAGEAYFIDLEIRGFASSGIKAYPAAASNGGEEGTVHVVGGLYRNNNVANLWLGPSNSEVRNVLSIQDGPAPSETDRGNTNQRGIWIDQSAGGLTIEDSDFVQRAPAVAPIVSTAASSGTMTDVRIHNEIQTPAIELKHGDWSGKNISISGSGGTDIVGGAGIDQVCRGADCAPPRSSALFVCSD